MERLSDFGILLIHRVDGMINITPDRFRGLTQREIESQIERSSFSKIEKRDFSRWSISMLISCRLTREYFKKFLKMYYTQKTRTESYLQLYELCEELKRKAQDRSIRHLMSRFYAECPRACRNDEFLKNIKRNGENFLLVLEELKNIIKYKIKFEFSEYKVFVDYLKQ